MMNMSSAWPWSATRYGLAAWVACELASSPSDESVVGDTSDINCKHLEKIVVTSFDVLGRQGEGADVTGPDAHTCILDPWAWEDHESFGAYKDVREWAGILQLSEGIKSAFARQPGAIYQCYGSVKHVVHVAGPDTISNWYSQEQAIEEIALAYKAAFQAFCKAAKGAGPAECLSLQALRIVQCVEAITLGAYGSAKE